MRGIQRAIMTAKVVFLVCLFIVCAVPQVKAADFEKGLEAFEDGDFATALKEWQPLAEQGNARAQFKYGEMYYKGNGVPQDYEETVKWFTKAAVQGDVYAQNALGLMYLSDEGVQDYKKALKWITKAAELGDIRAQGNLGYMYRKGEGVSQDYKKAAKWYTKAAEQGDIYAQFVLGVMYQNGEGVQDYKKAVKWYTKAAELGDMRAQGNLGNMYRKGEGVPSNNKLAYVWSSLAAASGYREAVKNSEICAEKLSPKELAEAQKLLAKIKNKKDNREKSSSQRIIIPANEN